MYCRCQERTERISNHIERIPCSSNYPIERIPCRYHQRQTKQNHVEHEQPKVEVTEVKQEPYQPIKKEKQVKKSKWPFWKCVTCKDGKVRFLKTNQCPIPRRGYSITKNPNCKCNPDDEFVPYEEYVKSVPKKTTNQPLPNEKRESFSNQKKKENTSKRNSKEVESLNTKKKNKKQNGHKEKEENVDSEQENKSRKKVSCCCSNRMPVCCCQHAHTFSKVTCRCQRPVSGNTCYIRKKSCGEISYSCRKNYTETGEEKIVCKKKEPEKEPDPCEEETEEYMVLLENGNLSPSNFGQTQIFIIAEESSNNPAIELFPIDPFTPLPPCECGATNRQSEANYQNPSSSINDEMNYGRSSIQNSRKSVVSTPSQSRRNSVLDEKKRSKK